MASITVARETSTSDAASPGFPIRDTEIYGSVSASHSTCPRSSAISLSVSLMNTVAINSIKISTISRWLPTASVREDERVVKNCSKQSSQQIRNF